MPRRALRWVALSIVAMGSIAIISRDAWALDSGKDRKGLFWGMGFGGGGAVTVPSRRAGGDVNFDIQLGAGVSQTLTLNFDIDIWTVIFDGERNIIINPGPEINFFISDTGLFLRGGMGAAMNVINAGKNSDFKIGFDIGAGLGWEFFANNNLAIGLALEGDYIVRRTADLAIIGFMFNLKYY